MMIVILTSMITISLSRYNLRNSCTVTNDTIFLMIMIIMIIMVIISLFRYNVLQFTIGRARSRRATLYRDVGREEVGAR